jgi:putative transposase
MCRVLEVSTSGYYAWRSRPASKRAQEDGVLLRQIRTVHASSRETYGVPRVYRELRDAGIGVGRDRVARLMRRAGLQGVSRRRFVTTTRRDEAARPAPDLVARRFEAVGPNQLWVADITYVPTWAGFLYLAMVLDVFSRKVIGWAMTTHLRTELVLDALQMATRQRQPESVIHHSDQGCQLEFKASLQHLVGGVANEEAPASSIGSRSASADAVTRPAYGRPARASTAILGGDRTRAVERAGRVEGRIVPARWFALVSREWRDGTVQVSCALWPLPFLR